MSRDDEQPQEQQDQEPPVRVPSWVNRIVHWECPRCSNHLKLSDEAPGPSVVCSCGAQFLVWWIPESVDAVVEALRFTRGRDW